MSSSTKTKAGWGKPDNDVTPPIHWWRPDNKRACDPDEIFCFSGPRITLADVLAQEFCVKCSKIVTDAILVLGNPQLDIMLKQPVN